MRTLFAPWKFFPEAISDGGDFETPKIFGCTEHGDPAFLAEIAVRKETEEIGRMIEAVPDLLAALRPIAEHGEISVPIIQAARTAIAKATGTVAKPWSTEPSRGRR